MKKIRFINSNSLKFIAALSMLIDHIGYILFPRVTVLRIIGRIAFPLFAFMIAEGCRYTRNRLKYLVSVATLAVLCQVGMFVALGSLDMGAPVTFTFSIIMVYALQNMKSKFFSECSMAKKLLSTAMFIGSVGLAFAANRILGVDYGFFGCLLPVFASLPHKPRCEGYPDGWDKIDRLPVCILTFSVGLAMLCYISNILQWWSLLAIPILLLYSGKKGKWNTKYFFYIFYPAHLALLYGILYILVKLYT